jgi:hypothetical protein
MRGQLSIELLLVLLIVFAFFLTIVPGIKTLEDAGAFVLNVQNAKSILAQLSNACERVLISNSQERISVYALVKYNVSGTRNISLIFSYGEERKNVSRENDFECFLPQKIEKGENQLLVRAIGGKALVRKI